jgi:uncharacterized protein YkwD
MEEQVKLKRFVLTSIGLLLLNTGCASFGLPEQISEHLTQEIRQQTNKIVTRALPLLPSQRATPEEIKEIETKVVDLINLDRQKNGLKLVVWDETAANAARQHVQEEADYGYISHWNIQGIKPQRRYTLAGGLDAVQENQSVTLWLNDGFRGISKDELYKVVAEHQTSMVNEQPPEDGHRKNILDPHHTGVGIAIAVGKFGVAMAQEFTNHYIEMKPVPKTALPGEKITLAGKILPGYSLTGVYAFWEELPLPQTKEELMKTHSYGDPPSDNLYFWARPNASGYYIPSKAGNLMAKNIAVDAKGNFSIQVPLSEKHQLDYISIEIVSKEKPKERFYGVQFVIEH